MASMNSQSNLQIFQNVLRKSKKRSSAGKAGLRSPQSIGEPSYSPSSYAESVSACDSHKEKDPLPFLRQTFRWHHKLQRKVELLEVPEEDWTEWVSVDVKKRPRVRVRQQLEFDESGVKVKDRLVLLDTSEILPKALWDLSKMKTRGKSGSFLLQPSDSSSEDDYHWLIPQHRKMSISHERYRDLFFKITEAKNMAPECLSISSKKTLEVLGKFIDHIFPEARKALEEANEGIRISYSLVWTLFRPGTIVYEKRLIPPLNESYEQCFRVRSAYDLISHCDGTTALRLVLEEIIYMQGNGDIPGTRTVATGRCIREFDGLRGITTRDLGVVPLSVFPKERQREICTAIVQRSREFLRLSAIQFSIWNYRGPVGLLNRIAGKGTSEERKLLHVDRPWQRHTHENVVIDIQSSTAHFNDRFPRWLYSFQDDDDGLENPAPILISRKNSEEKPDLKEGDYIEPFLLICRGYLPAYLVSSRVYAVNILVSELYESVWDEQSLWGSAALSFPNESRWYTLLQAYYEQGKEMDSKLGRHQTRGAGLVLVLQGSKILTRMVANNISAKLKRPLVSLSLAEKYQRLSEASKASLRWSGVLHLDLHRVPNNQRDSRELTRHLSFFPSVVLVTCNDVTELGTGCESEVDGVIACDKFLGDTIPGLWRLYLTTELPEVTATVSEQRLNNACRILAQIESRESRMGKILKTARRMAVAETSAIGFSHILDVIRSSISSDRLEEFKDIWEAGDELGSRLDSTTK